MLYEMGKVSALGRDRSHGALAEVGCVRVDEKIDGSQISFGKDGGKLLIRSRSRYLDLDNPDKMFALAVEQIRRVESELTEGFTYLGEYLQKPKHNVLAYDRVPKGNIALFDVVMIDGSVWDAESVYDEANRLGFEPVNFVEMSGAEALRVARSGEPPFKTSQLGGIAEGCVIKAGDAVSNRVIAKVVADQFKEVKGDRPKREGNDKADIAITMANRFCPPARYHKAVQKLKEAGEYTGQMRDIPKIRELISRDLEEECGEQMREELYDALRKDIFRMSLQPLSGWYDQYLNSAFGEMQRAEE